MEKEEIFTNKAPTPKGAYSQAVKVGDFVYISGQLPIDPSTNQPLEGTLEEKIHQVFKNTNEILLAANTNFDHVVRISIYISDIENWDIVNKIYTEYLTCPILPSRTVVPTKDLHFGVPMEMDAIAIIPQYKKG